MPHYHMCTSNSMRIVMYLTYSVDLGTTRHSIAIYYDDVVVCM